MIGERRWAHQGTSTQAPPTSFIFFSASLEKNLALTIKGCLGRTPLPSTLKNPYNDSVIFEMKETHMNLNNMLNSNITLITKSQIQVVIVYENTYTCTCI